MPGYIEAHTAERPDELLFWRMRLGVDRCGLFTSRATADDGFMSGDTKDDPSAAYGNTQGHAVE